MRGEMETRMNTVQKKVGGKLRQGGGRGYLRLW